MNKKTGPVPKGAEPRTIHIQFRAPASVAAWIAAQPGTSADVLIALVDDEIKRAKARERRASQGHSQPKS